MDSTTNTTFHRVETESVETHDGLKLAAWRYPANRPTPRARVVLVHGYAEHSGRYAWMTAALGAAGYECHLFDLRGHGRSEGPRGHVARFADYLDDLDRVIQQGVAVGRDGIGSPRAVGPVDASRLPLFAVAHSLGGLIALEYVRLRRDVFDVLATSSPFLAPAFKLPPMVAELGSLASLVLPSQTVKSTLNAEWLSHDTAVVEAYSRDPLVFGTVTLGWFREVRRAQEETFERANEVRLPVLFLLGDADRVADWQRSKAVFEQLGSAEKSLKVYPGFFHEVLNEIGREQVLHDLLAWLDAHSAEPGG